MAHPLAEHPVRAITVDEALRMHEAGVFENPQRIELLLGVLTEKPVSSPAHVEMKARLRDWFAGFDSRALRLEDPLVAPDGISMPEPDVAVVVPGDPASHPTTALLVIEVSKTSLKLDTTVKPSMYASMGVPDYWVVDVVQHRVIVFRHPTPNGYASKTTHEAPGTLEPLDVDVAPLDLAQLFR